MDEKILEHEIYVKLRLRFLYFIIEVNILIPWAEVSAYMSLAFFFMEKISRRDRSYSILVGYRDFSSGYWTHLSERQRSTNNHLENHCRDSSAQIRTLFLPSTSVLVRYSCIAPPWFASPHCLKMLRWKITTVIICCKHWCGGGEQKKPFFWSWNFLHKIVCVIFNVCVRKTFKYHGCDAHNRSFWKLRPRIGWFIWDLMTLATKRGFKTVVAK